MAVTTENQADLPAHRWRGIASSIIGAASIAFTLLLLWIAVSRTQPPGPVVIVLQVLSSAMLCANLIGLALGFLGARDRSSRKLYPLLGLGLNIANLMTYVTLAFIGG
jgi:Family of unknown function (DUF6142)